LLINFPFEDSPDVHEYWKDAFRNCLNLADDEMLKFLIRFSRDNFPINEEDETNEMDESE